MIAHHLAQRVLGLFLERDKQQHFVVCFLLTAGLLVTSAGPGFTVLAVITVGLGKELWDKRYGSGFCWYDMLANGLGIVAGMIAAMPLYI